MLRKLVIPLINPDIRITKGNFGIDDRPLIALHMFRMSSRASIRVEGNGEPAADIYKFLK